MNKQDEALIDAFQNAGRDPDIVTARTAENGSHTWAVAVVCTITRSVVREYSTSDAASDALWARTREALAILTKPGTVFVMTWQDRRSGVGVLVFDDADTAIKHARTTAHSYASGTVDETLTEGMVRAGVLYHGDYSPEGDWVRVEQRRVLHALDTI